MANIAQSALAATGVTYVTLHNLRVYIGNQYCMTASWKPPTGYDSCDHACDRLNKDLEDDEDDYLDDTDPEKSMYVKGNSMLYGPKKAGQKPPLTHNFLRKYIKIAKNRGR